MAERKNNQGRGRGGKRKGAGRRPILDRPRTLTITLETSAYSRLKKIASKRGVSAGALIRDAVREYLARRKS